MNKNERKMLLIGIGAGVAAGIGAGYFAGYSVAKRRGRDEVRKARKAGYEKGVEEATEETKKWIDQYVLVVDADDPKGTQEAINKYIAAQGAETNSDSDKSAEGAKKGSEGPGKASGDDIYTEPPVKDPNDLPDDINFIGVRREGDNIIFEAAMGTKLYYPVYLFLDKKGDSLGTVKIRENLRAYENDIAKLRVVWNALGWGTYIPDLDGYPAEEDINDWDLDIQDSLGDEPEEKTLERERYLDEVERYISHPEEAPRIISRKEFDDECHLEKVYIDWYEGDNKFVENTDMDREIDAVTMLGVSDGRELFGEKHPTEDDDDPDIVHVKNFKMNSVMEVTRYHRAFSSIQDGSAYIHGSSD